MREFQKLIDVKSIVTISMTMVVCYLAIKQSIDIKDIYLIVISFYFGTQHKKKGDFVNE